MTNQNFFLNPHSGFYYVKDSLVWGDLFSTPLPKDPENSKLGEICLSNYFIVRDIFIEEAGFSGMKKLLSCRPNFYRISKFDRNIVFSALGDFLQKFNKKFSTIFVIIPNHDEVQPRENFQPATICFDEPQQLVINKDDGMFSVVFEKNLFMEIHKYIFNTEHKESLNDTYIFRFSFPCFTGLIFD